MVNTSPPLLRLNESSLKDLSESAILRSFDLIIHAHSVYLYFLDNSSLRLLVRFIFQVNILSPKSPLSAFASIDLPLRRATILLLGTFALGFIPHLFFSVPTAGEPTQGYLHGGLLLDFIGQRGPISRLRLLAVDLIILLLQLTMLAVIASTAPPDPATLADVPRVAVSADLDRVEQGEGNYETQSEEQPEGSGETETIRYDTGYEHVTVRVGVVETIKSLWDDETPIVRRFR